MLTHAQHNAMFRTLSAHFPNAHHTTIERACNSAVTAMRNAVTTPAPTPRYMGARTGHNPVIKRTSLRAYPGYTIRAYRDGMYDCVHTSGAISLGHNTFHAALGFARSNGTRG